MLNIKVFSVGEYVEYLNASLQTLDAVVEGEISEYKINQGKWIFFKIKDNSAILDCFSTVFKLKMPLEDGMRVRLYGRPSIYGKSGRFSITVDWVEPVGEGALKRAFELLKQELEKEGLFAQERKRQIPRFPKKIGLIASRESAAYGDFMKVLKARFGGIEIYLIHTQVQGSEAVQSIVNAFSYFNANKEKLGLDFIVLIRGGGSIEDLAAFNSKDVAYAVFGSKVPVVCGVGHEQDETLADYVADIRASTPSNAAELISPDREDLLARISKMENMAYYKIQNAIDEKKRGISDSVSALDDFMNVKIRALNEKTTQLLSHLKFIQEKIIMLKLKIDSFLRLIKSFNPQTVLDKGYVIIRKSGSILLSSKNLKSKDLISLQFKDGEIQAEVL